MSSEIEIVVGDVTDVEARVLARYHGSEQGIELRGTLRGPFCEKSRTLPAEFVFHSSVKDNDIHAEAIGPDPCTGLRLWRFGIGRCRNARSRRSRLRANRGPRFSRTQ